MRRIALWLTSLIAPALIVASQASAQDDDRGPVLVELFTSQGCHSCPPADAILGELAQRPDVIALALHVDYWDYLGWRDSLAIPGNTDRQKEYRETRRQRSIYTPQAMIDGEIDVVGSREYDMGRAIEIARDKPNPARVEFDDVNGRMIARIAPRVEDYGLSKPATVWMVTYALPQTVDIQRGENAGKTLTYHNVVTSWVRMGEWRGEATNYDAPMAEGAGGAVVLIQAGRGGPILGAAEYRR